MKTSVNKYSVAKPMINPVSKAGSIFFLLNRSSPQMVKKRNKVVIQEKASHGIVKKLCKGQW